MIHSVHFATQPFYWNFHLKFQYFISGISRCFFFMHVTENITITLIESLLLSLFLFQRVWIHPQVASDASLYLVNSLVIPAFLFICEFESSRAHLKKITLTCSWDLGKTGWDMLQDVTIACHLCVRPSNLARVRSFLLLAIPSGPPNSLTFTECLAKIRMKPQGPVSQALLQLVFLSTLSWSYPCAFLTDVSHVFIKHVVLSYDFIVP